MNAPYRRAILGLSALLVMAAIPTPGLAPLVAQSSDNSRYAAVVVDAESGEVLFGRFADSRRYPASVTKVMTLYLTFEALAAGKVSLDDEIVVSPRAASQPPSKLGLAAGQRIRLDDAMRATAIRSANDMALAIAEHVGGSEARFAAMATLKAEQLGMTQTRYVNPHGLPDSRQLTSAKDLAILSRAVMRDYPQYYSYFGQHDWAYQGRSFRNTNGLLLRGEGYDGIKTGFTNASGYNLAASAVRDGKRIITIVLGGRSSATRNAHVAELMNTGFEVQRRRKQGEPIQVAQTFFEQRGFGIGGSVSPQAPIAYASIGSVETGIGSDEVEYASTPAPAALPTEVTPAPSTAVAYTALPPPAPVAAPVRTYASAPTVPATRPTVRAEARPGSSSLTASLNGAAGTPLRAPAGARATAAPAGRWAVQVGAFRDEAVATDWLTEINRRFRTQFAGTEQAVQSAAGWHRSRFTGMTEAAAEAACAALAERRISCLVVQPE
jgi:D-alanyl-D-alanine carboxypeptidase (penicillin-binding protein 5/6)